MAALCHPLILIASLKHAAAVPSVVAVWIAHGAESPEGAPLPFLESARFTRAFRFAPRGKRVETWQTHLLRRNLAAPPKAYRISKIRRSLNKGAAEQIGGISMGHST